VPVFLYYIGHVQLHFRISTYRALGAAILAHRGHYSGMIIIAIAAGLFCNSFSYTFHYLSIYLFIYLFQQQQEE
jgi:hypothetical protein